MRTLNYNAGREHLKNWLIEETKLDTRYLGKCEAIFAQGNGYMGVRNTLEESYVGEVRNTFITGTFNKASLEEVTELPNIPDMAGIKITIDGYPMDLTQGDLQSYKRTINLKNGEVIRKIKWKSQTGIDVSAVFKRIVSLADEHVMGASIELTTDRAVDVRIETGIDGTVTNSGAQHFMNIKRRIYDGVYMEYISQTTQSKVLVAQHTACSISDKEAKVLPVMERRTLGNRYSLISKPGVSILFEKISVIHSSRDLEYDEKNIVPIDEVLKKDGMDSLHRSFAKGYDVLQKESANAWAEYWKDNDIQIDGADFDQLAIRFALYHLNIMVKKDDNRVGIGAKALTGEGYKGHSFWDTEMFILPYFTFTQPTVARTLLEYRYRNLTGAYLKAKEHGYKGAMYPWECAWVDDGEVTPLYLGVDVVTGKAMKVWTGLIEQHISADIAYAVEQYYLVTGDQEYMNQYGYEIIIATALFWASRLDYNEKLERYEILDVIGPDEYKEHVNNNAFTNYMAEYNMQQALKIIKDLKKNNKDIYRRLDNKLNLTLALETIENKVEKLYLPKPNETGIIPQFDNFFQLNELDLSKYKNSSEVLTIYKDYNTEQLNQYMVCKQADTVMLFFLLDTLFQEEIKKKNFLFYENITLHDSSLSKCIHAILANDFSFHDMSYQLYEKAITIDLGDNMASSDEGIHSASIGGIWESTVMGFGGVRMEGENLRIAPKIPETWTKLSFPLEFQNCRLQVEISQKEITVENKGEKAITIIMGIDKDKTIIEAGKIVKRDLMEKL